MNNSIGSGTAARALVYPELLPNLNWIKHSLLYWDGLMRFVPTGYQETHNPEMQLAYDVGLITDIEINIDYKSGLDIVSSIDKVDFQNRLNDIDSLMEVMNILYDHLSIYKDQPITRSLLSLYPDKFDDAWRFYQYLKEHHQSDETPYLAKSQRDTWVWLAPAMLLIACFVSYINKYTSDKAISTLCSHERLAVLEHPRILSKFTQNAACTEEVQFLANLEIPFPRLDQAENLSMDALIKFHSRSSQERRAFRDVINRLFASIPKGERPELVRMYFKDCALDLKKAVRDYRQTLKYLRLSSLTSLLRIGTITYIPAALLNHFVGNPMITNLLAGTTLTLSAANWIGEASFKWKDFVQKNPMHYLFMLNKILR